MGTSQVSAQHLATQRGQTGAFTRLVSLGPSNEKTPWVTVMFDCHLKRQTGAGGEVQTLCKCRCPREMCFVTQTCQYHGEEPGCP